MHVFERGWLSSNCIFFDDGSTSWLVDSGYSTHSTQTLELIALKLSSRSLDFLLNTHLHSDHCGGNAALQAKYPALVTVIPPGQASSVEIWDPEALFYTPTGQLCNRFKFEQTLKSGSSVQLGMQMWEIHAAGGHDPHAVIFFEPISKVLISADALWQSGFGVVFPELEGIQAFGEVAATLDLIERLNPNMVVPGHGAVFKFTPAVLEIARQKLAGFEEDPIKLARHGAKVLLKFKLLEKQKLPFREFLLWATNTSCLLQYHRQYFNDFEFSNWIEKLCAELVKAGAATRKDNLIFNQ